MTRAPIMDDARIEPRAWLVVALMFLFMLINWADKAVIGLSAVPIMHELGLTHTEFGAVGSSFFLLFSLSGIVIGFVVNRVPAKPVLLAMAVIWALTQFPMIGSVGIGTLIASRVVLGAGEGPGLPVALHATYKWFADRRRTLPTSIIISGAAFGAGVVAPGITAIIIRYSWHAAFGTLGVVGLIWALLWQMLGREGRLDAAAPADRTPPAGRVPYRALLFSRTALGVFIAGFVAYWSLTLSIIWLAGYLVQGSGFTLRQAGWILVLPSLTQIVLSPVLAALSQWLMRRGVSSRRARGVLAGLCVTVGGIAMLLMPLLPPNGWRIAAVTLAFSIGGLIFTFGAAMIGEITPAGQRGAMLGVMNSIQTMAGLLAPLVMGRLVDIGADPVVGFRNGFMLAGMFVVAGGVAGVALMHPDADRARFAKRGVAGAMVESVAR